MKKAIALAAGGVLLFSSSAEASVSLSQIQRAAVAKTKVMLPHRQFYGARCSRTICGGFAYTNTFRCQVIGYRVHISGQNIRLTYFRGPEGCN